MTKGQMPRTVEDLNDLREKVAKWGTLEKIKGRTSPALFLVYVSGEMIEAWQDGGWVNVLEHYSELFPYIPAALEELGLFEIKTTLGELPRLLPEFGEFEEEDIYDAMTFLINHRLEVFDDRLKRYSRERRMEISKEFHGLMGRLDDLSERVWGYQSPGEGWEGLLRYIERKYNAE